MFHHCFIVWRKRAGERAPTVLKTIKRNDNNMMSFDAEDDLMMIPLSEDNVIM